MLIKLCTWEQTHEGSFVLTWCPPKVWKCMWNSNVRQGARTDCGSQLGEPGCVYLCAKFEIALSCSQPAALFLYLWSGLSPEAGEECPWGVCVALWRRRFDKDRGREHVDHFCPSLACFHLEFSRVVCVYYWIFRAQQMVLPLLNPKRKSLNQWEKYFSLCIFHCPWTLWCLCR